MRIEGAVGHVLQTTPLIRSLFKWGFVGRGVVAARQSSADAIHVDLDLESTLNNWPNPALDLGFDVALARRCNDEGDKVTFVATLRDFTSSVEFSLWADIGSLGFLKLIGELIEWYANERATPPQLEQTFEVKLEPGVDCNSLQLEVHPQANVTLCCFGSL